MVGENDSGWKTEAAARLGAVIVRSMRLSGGDVAESFRFDLDDGRTVFAKTHTSPPHRFFDTEAAGLEWLRAAAPGHVPAVLAVDERFLVLEWIDEGRSVASTEAVFGRLLASIHQAGAPSFGRQDRRPTGSRQLPNECFPTWAEAYAKNRLLPIARLGGDTGTLGDTTVRRLEQVAARLPEIGGDPEPPARLHGDLWGGNRLIDSAGHNWLIDPAAHGGHREFDLAMMDLFGGFGAECFAAYDEAFALADGWRDRVPVHQLAPLAVHAIKFGGRYESATLRALDAVDRL